MARGYLLTTASASPWRSVIGTERSKIIWRPHTCKENISSQVTSCRSLHSADCDSDHTLVCYPLHVKVKASNHAQNPSLFYRHHVVHHCLCFVVVEVNRKTAGRWLVVAVVVSGSLHLMVVQAAVWREGFRAVTTAYTKKYFFWCLHESSKSASTLRSIFKNVLLCQCHGKCWLHEHARPNFF